MMIQALPHFPTTGGGGGGGSITYVGGKSVTHTSSGAITGISLTNLTGGLASAPAENDFVVISYAAYSTNSDLSISGYTEQCDIFGSDRANLGVFTKFMGAVPDTSFDISAINAVSANTRIIRVLVFRGVDLTTPMDVAVVTKVGSGSGNAIIDAITPVTAGAVVLGSAVAQAGNVLNVVVMDNTGSYSPFLASKDGRLTSCFGGKTWGGGTEGPFEVGGAAGVSTSYATCALALRPA